MPQPAMIRIEPSESPPPVEGCRTTEPYFFGMAIYNDSVFATRRLQLGMHLVGDVEQVQEASYAVF